MVKKDNEIKRLYRDREDKIIAGVCSGIADYFNIDPIWTRLIAILLLFLDGIGLIAYIILWILMPENPKQKTSKKSVIEEKADTISKKVKSEFNKEKKKKAKKHNIDEDEVIKHYKFKRHNSDSNVVIGIILILIGALFFAKEFFWHFIDKIFWPSIIIGIGLILLLRRK